MWRFLRGCDVLVNPFLGKNAEKLKVVWEPME
jgi:hypothetical protein